MFQPSLFILLKGGCLALVGIVTGEVGYDFNIMTKDANWIYEIFKNILKLIIIQEAQA